MNIKFRIINDNILETIWKWRGRPGKLDFVFRRNERVHLNRRGASVQSTTGSRGVPISGSNAGYTMFRGTVESTVYPLHSPVSPSLPLPGVTALHHISTGLYVSTPLCLHGTPNDYNTVPNMWGKKNEMQQFAKL